MIIDWSILAEIIKPVAGAAAGFVLARFFERKPKVLSFFLYSNAIRIRGDNPTVVHSHSVVIRNVGKSAATNLRVSHQQLPDYSVFPEAPCTEERLPNGTVDLVFPLLRPREQLTISYLYAPPLRFDQVHAGIKHDDGFAQQVAVEPMVRFPAWQQAIMLSLMGIGAIAVIYIVAQYLLQMIG